MKERRWLKWVVLFVLALLVAVPAVGTKEAQAASTVASGTYGDDNLTWKVTSDGKLTISGTGEMTSEEEYSNLGYLMGRSEAYPWYEYADDFTKVVIKSGVTSVDVSGFRYCDIKSISIPDTVTSISDRGSIFEMSYAWTSLEKITVSEDNTKYSSVDGVLYNKDQTTLIWWPVNKNKGGSFTVPSTVTKIGDYAFDGNYLCKLVIPASVTKLGTYCFGVHFGKYGDLTVVFQGSAPKVSEYVGDYSYGSWYYIKYPASEASSWEKIDESEWDASSYKSYKLSVKSAAEITLSSTSISYTGKKRTPSVTVEVNGETLTKGTDYTLSWSSSKRTSIGKYTVTITGKGDYTGSVKKTFKIVPKKVTLKSATKSSSSGKLTVKWSKVSGSVKYQIAYKVKGGSWKYKTVSSSTYSKTLTGLKSGKYYYVKVRAYRSVDGTKYYGSWSTTKKVKVK